MDSERFATRTLTDPRIKRVLAAAVDAADPGRLVRDSLRLLPEASGRIYALGLGKAAAAMTKALAECIPVTEALTITKHGESAPGFPGHLMLGGHPVPDERSLAAGRAALEFASRCQERDLLICLLSGGGSALAVAPVQGVGLGDLQEITASLLACGASIEEINTVRRSLDTVKGGGLAAAAKGRVASLILSDVLGNPLESIASGPTAPNPTTAGDALGVLSRYGITAHKAVLNALRSPDRALSPERVQNYVIGDVGTAARAALSQAEKEGCSARIEDLGLRGEARDVGFRMAQVLKRESASRPRPFCLISGGETTVTIRGRGKGGRNQELALAAVDALDRASRVLLVALATDGEDGPTDAAGAVVSGDTRRRALELGMNADAFLSRNDAYAYFSGLGDLLKPGPTGTNVNDLVLLCGL